MVQSTLKYQVSKNWNMKGDLRITQLLNDYFMILFEYEIDKYQVFQEGSWFNGRVGLFVKTWYTSFKTNEEIPSLALFWVRLAKLPLEHQNDDVFEALGNLISMLLGAYDKIRESKNVAFSRICVKLYLNSPLLAIIQIDLPNEGITWVQIMNYENVPFRCIIFSTYGQILPPYRTSLTRTYYIG